MEKLVRVECQGAALVNIELLLPFQGELKALSEENYQKLKAEILRDGFSAPFFVWRKITRTVPDMEIGERETLVDLYILDGHQRLRTLERMAAEGYVIPELPVVWVDAPDVAAAKRKLLSFTSQYGEMSAKSLATFIQDAKLEFQDVAISFRFPEVKFDAVNDILNPAPEEKEEPGDGAGEQEGELRVKKGELWELGEHRLLCGDSLEYASFDRLMQGEEADCVWTDPPYNVDYEGKTADAMKIENDSMSDSEFLNFLSTVFQHLARASKMGAPFYIAHADSEGFAFRAAVRAAKDWDLKQCLVWVKNTIVMGRQDYQWQHEPILYGWKQGAAHRWFGERNKSTVLNFDKPSKSDLHPTMKPVELVEYCLKNSTEIRDVVLDAFGGSGTTLMAAHRLQRRARLIELDPKYASRIVARWEEASGRQARLITA